MRKGATDLSWTPSQAREATRNGYVSSLSSRLSRSHSPGRAVMMHFGLGTDRDAGCTWSRGAQTELKAE